MEIVSEVEKNVDVVKEVENKVVLDGDCLSQRVKEIKLQVVLEIIKKFKVRL